MLKRIYNFWINVSLFYKMGVAIVLGIVLGVCFKEITILEILANLFIGSLKAIAPILVFVLICSSLANASAKVGKLLSTVILIYMFTTFMAGLTAVIISIAFPTTITLSESAKDVVVTNNIDEMLSSVILNIVDNPLKAIMNGNYLSILFWSILFGIFLKKVGHETTINLFTNIAAVLNKVVAMIVKMAPYGILGLVYVSVSKNGIEIFYEYGKLILLLVSAMLFTALVVNPIIVAIMTRKNPYPLIFTCLKESGTTAFFTRSSVANIPINMQLCNKLGLDKDFYSVSIALGSTINMNGSAVTISVITLAICNTLGIEVNFIWAFFLCIISVIAACGASGVAGGSLLLIPLSCSLFGIDDDIAMQGIFVGFIIGVIQDSVETALNSSSDAIFTATTQYYYRRKQNEEMNYLGEFSKK